MRHIKWREASRHRIQEVNPCHETSTELSGRGPGKYLPPELNTIQATEWVSLVNPSNPIKIIIPNYL